MSWSWIDRCLEPSRIPPPLGNMITAMLRGQVRLVLQGKDRGGLFFAAGLPQGCPLSCFVFLLCADPLLQKLMESLGARAVSGFVDDWSIAIQGATFPEALSRLESILRCVEDFELASGSKMHRRKPAIVPSRVLTPDEAVACNNFWADLRVSYCERLLGLFIGCHATVKDQFQLPLRKFEATLCKFAAKSNKM